jgi:hypothetical protein
VTTTYDQLLERIIDDGIAEVREAYADPEDHHKRDGAIEGFEACRGKTPSELVELWSAAERQSAQMHVADCDIRAYWKQRYKALQLEWCLNVISVGFVSSGQPPLLGHLPTARGAMKYAEIVGVRGESAS